MFRAAFTSRSRTEPQSHVHSLTLPQECPRHMRVFPPCSTGGVRNRPGKTPENGGFAHGWGMHKARARMGEGRLHVKKPRVSRETYITAPLVPQLDLRISS